MDRKRLSYATFFSGAGVGCQEFTNNGFECVVTNELLKKRLNVQKFNGKCKHDAQYILGDIKNQSVKNAIYEQIKIWNNENKTSELDVAICTPPCQGMSVANHHKTNELDRNSLIIESITIIENIRPRFFIFENVRTFLTTKCLDVDGKLKTIREAIELHLDCYNIAFRIVNFKDFGNPSQRTRTIVVGVRRDLQGVSPFEIMPDRRHEKTVRQVIGKMKPLNYGQIDPSDIYHSARPYPRRMESWIKDLEEGESAFNNKRSKDIPHTLKNGKIVINKNKNGDKYKRCYWDLPMPCIHTRNDIMASQMTVHPKDNRVFSVRELMRLMSIKDSFRWSDIGIDQLNEMSNENKLNFLRTEELNIRRCIGETVPPVIFDGMAKKIRDVLEHKMLSEQDISRLVRRESLFIGKNLKNFLKTNAADFSYHTLSKICEAANLNKKKHASYYTSRHASFFMVETLPLFGDNSTVSILEPSCGSGMFIPPLVKKYQNCKKVIIDVLDIDKQALETAKILLQTIKIPNNVKICFINADFLTFCPKRKYDIVVGNPPFGKITNNLALLKQYKFGKYNRKTNNIFAFFIEHAMTLGDHVSLIVPKALLSTPEFNMTREMIESCHVDAIVDFGQKVFDVKIETVGISLQIKKRTRSSKTKVTSFITGSSRTIFQSYIMSEDFPYWLIYRNEYFDKIAQKMRFGVLDAYRDRHITKRMTKNHGSIRVLKSRNIESNNIRDIPDYDSFIDKKQLKCLDVRKYLNMPTAVLIPNLTYNPRACFMPKDSICDGSVAIATPKNGVKVNRKTLKYYGGEEFRKFYAIARNRSRRSLNIDSNAIFFFGKVK